MTKEKVKELRETYYLAKQIRRIMAGDLRAFGQTIIRVEPSDKRVPMRTFYVKPHKKHMTPDEHMKELKKFNRRYLG